MLGHSNSICIGDSGLPVPAEVGRIDLAVTHGIKPFLTTGETVVAELCIEKAIVATEAGLAIPRDLSIVGYDGLEIATYLVPALTTIHQPSFGLGAKAAEILIEHIEKKTKLPSTLTLEPRLVVRDSVVIRQEE